MTATNQNASIHMGDAVTIEIPITSSVGEKIKKTIKSAKYKVASSVNTEAYVIKTTGPAQDIDIEKENNVPVLRIFLHPDDTLSLPRPGRYYHEAEITDDSNRPYTVMTGTLTVEGALIG